MLIGVFLFFLAPDGPLSARVERPGPAIGIRFFETQVQPILQAHCLTCHGGDQVRSGLNLTSRETLLQGGKRGPAVSLDKPKESLLLQAVNQQELKMPPKGKLSQAQIDILSRWVKMGAPWSETVAAVKHHGPPRVDDQARNSWSFRPVVRPRVPAVQRSAWVKTPIDAFILAKLEADGLEPAPPAEQTALL